jgi:hypothetical protein
MLYERYELFDQLPAYKVRPAPDNPTICVSCLTEEIFGIAAESKAIISLANSQCLQEI